MITNREIATAAWLAVLLVLSLMRAEVRTSFRRLGRAFFKSKIILPFLLFIAWFAAWIWCAARMDLWKAYLLKDTAIWFIVSGATLLFGAIRLAEDKQFVGKTIRSTLEAAAILGFFLNIVTFHLIIELALLPIIAFLVIAITLAERDVRLARAKRLLGVLLGGISVSLVILTAIEIVRQRQELDFDELWRSFAMTVWLPIVALPFVLVFAFVAAYEEAFMRVRFATGGRRSGFKTELAILLGLNVRIRDVHAFRGGWARQVSEAPTFRTALHRIRTFRQHRVKQQLEQQERQHRLRSYAGIDGTDEKGQRLDQREFTETKEALRWLATCHMGWYRRPGSRYHADLLDRLGGFSSKGLPEGHGIVMEVQGDGQAWYAWRRTVSGWVFGIGANGAPPDQWLYDAADPPTGFPGLTEGWDHFFPGNATTNWANH